MKSLLILVCGWALSQAHPLPQGLTEEEFRSFPEEVEAPNKIDIVSGYAKVRRQGRMHNNGGSVSNQFTFSKPLTVKNPLEFGSSGRGLRSQSRNEDLNRFPEMAPVFKLTDMLAKEAAQLKMKIEQASLQAAQAAQEAKERVKVIAQKAMDEAVVGRVEVDSIIEQAIDSAIKEAEEIMGIEEEDEEVEESEEEDTSTDKAVEIDVMVEEVAKPTEEDSNEISEDEDEDKTTESTHPSRDVDLGSVQEV